MVKICEYCGKIGEGIKFWPLRNSILVFQPSKGHRLNWVNSAEVVKNEGGGGGSAVVEQTTETWSSKWRWNWSASMCWQDGTRPLPSVALMECHNWRSCAFSASIFKCQPVRVPLKQSMQLQSLHFAYQTVTASGEPDEREDCTNFLTERFTLRHSWIEWTLLNSDSSIWDERSRTDVISLLYSSASSWTERPDRLSGWPTISCRLSW